MRELIRRLPVKFRGEIGEKDFWGLEEIRLRAGRPMELYYGGGTADGHAAGRIRFLGKVKRADVLEMLNYLTGYSPYAYEEEIRKGFFTIEGGHRVGIVGHTSMTKTAEDREAISDVPEITGINLRIARQVKGCALPLMSRIRKGRLVHNTILLAPPGVGKTTVLRDIVRILSDGADGGEPLKVGLVDERSEIAACRMGVPQNDIGERTDVLDNCPKILGMEMLIRSMSPQIVAVDELAAKDVGAVEKVIHSGCGLIGTVHGASIEEFMAKKGLGRMLREGWITRVILLTEENGKRGFVCHNFSDKSYSVS